MNFVHLFLGDIIVIAILLEYNNAKGKSISLMGESISLMGECISLMAESITMGESIQPI